MVMLQKGQKVALDKSFKNLQVGLGWDTNRYSGQSDFDLDVSIFMIGKDGKCPTEKEFIFYDNLAHSSGSVTHTGDNRTGDGDGDDESILVALDKVPQNIDKIVVTVTIYESDVRNQNFGMVSNSYIRIVDSDTGEEKIHYDLGEDFSIETSLVVGEIYRHNGGFKFSAVGSGYSGGLKALCTTYGIQAE